MRVFSQRPTECRLFNKDLSTMNQIQRAQQSLQFAREALDLDRQLTHMMWFYDTMSARLKEEFEVAYTTARTSPTPLSASVEVPEKRFARLHKRYNQELQRLTDKMDQTLINQRALSA